MPISKLKPRCFLRSRIAYVLPVLIASLILGAAPLIADLPPDAATRILNDLKYLASDELEGRGLGTEGLNVAADAIRDAFTNAGLDVNAVDGGAFQEFEVVAGTELESPNTLTWVDPNGEQTLLTYDEQVRTCSFGAAGKFQGSLVFCGYGIVHTESREVDGKPVETVIYDDFAGVDVTGKVAVILRRTPQQGQENSPFNDPHGGSSPHAALNSKLKHAIERGAAAVLFVNEGYSGRSDLEKLQSQQAAAEQRVIDAAIALVTGAVPSPHAHQAEHGHSAKAVAPHGEAKKAHPLAVPQTDTADKGEEVHGSTAKRPANPHDAHSAESDHTAPLTLPDDELKRAVTHLQEVRKLIAEYNPDPLFEFGYNGNRRGESIPVMQVTRAAMEGPIQGALGKSLDELEAEIDATGQSQSAELTGWQAEGQTSLRLNRVQVKNVIGVLPGAGPLANETIVVGAHYDHLGVGGEGSMAIGSSEIHNGADDNASGTAALIELARQLAARPTPLPRRVVFIAFTGEERGLLGSAHYVKEPVFPLENTIAMFNMDMVGRLTDDKLTVFGTGTSSRWDEQIDQEAEERQFAISKKPEGFGPSDHSSFYAKQIPVLHFFTGTHNDYHRPTDDWEKINVDGMVRIVDLLEELIVATAEADERPEYVAVQGRAEMETRTGSRPYFGSIPDFSGEESGYALQGVSPGSPADKAGLKGGDVIIKLGEHTVTGLDDFDLALRKFSAGEEVMVTIRRAGEKLTLPVTLATPR